LGGRLEAAVRTTLTIAGVRLQLDSGDLRLRTQAQPSYELFRELESDPSDSLFSMELAAVADGLPDVHSLTRVFEADESWSVFIRGEEFLLVLGPLNTDGPVCVTTLERSLKRGTIYCGKPLILEDGAVLTVRNPLAYPLDQLLLMHILAGMEGVLLHAAGVVVGGKGYLFAGRSGAGKSTISNEFHARGAEVLSDDRVAVRKIGGEFRVFGTPWSGEAELAENRDLPLGGIFFLRHGREDSTVRLLPAEAVGRMAPVASVPWYDSRCVSSILGLAGHMAFRIPSWDLTFKPHGAVVDFVERIATDV
jgi:hypothetical protein